MFLSNFFLLLPLTNVVVAPDAAQRWSNIDACGTYDETKSAGDGARPKWLTDRLPFGDLLPKPSAVIYARAPRSWKQKKIGAKVPLRANYSIG
jgi:hypothetical protein